MERIQTSDGLFAAGNPVTGTSGTIVTAKWLNDIQEELVGVIDEAGIVLDGGSRTQLRDAIVAIIAANVNAPLVAATTPTENVGPLIFVLDRWHWAVWVTTAFYTGYRSLHVGDWYIGSMSQNHRPHEIDGIGGVYDIADFPSLWAWAQENGHVVAAGDWEPHAGNYALIGTTQFRVPDYRDMFPRAAGTDRDTANAAGVGFYQADAMQRITGSLQAPVYFDNGAGALKVKAVSRTGFSGSSTTSLGGFDFDSALSSGARTSSETRGAATRTSPVVLV